MKYKDIMLKGTEHFLLNGAETDLSVNDFWQWYFSDMIDIKSKLAEYLVTKAIDCGEPFNTGYWSSHTVYYWERRIEIRSASYMRSSCDRSPSLKNVRHIDIRTREGDMYIFCLLPGKTRKSADPLNLNNCRFYIVPMWYIDKVCMKYRTIQMEKVMRLVEETKYPKFKERR